MDREQSPHLTGTWPWFESTLPLPSQGPLSPQTTKSSVKAARWCSCTEGIKQERCAAARSPWCAYQNNYSRCMQNGLWVNGLPTLFGFGQNDCLWRKSESFRRLLLLKTVCREEKRSLIWITKQFLLMLLLFMSYLSPGVGKNGENKRNLSVKHFKMDAIHDKNLILSLSNEQHITHFLGRKLK